MACTAPAIDGTGEGVTVGRVVGLGPGVKVGIAVPFSIGVAVMGGGYGVQLTSALAAMSAATTSSSFLPISLLLQFSMLVICSRQPVLCPGVGVEVAAGVSVISDGEPVTVPVGVLRGVAAGGGPGVAVTAAAVTLATRSGLEMGLGVGVGVRVAA